MHREATACAPSAGLGVSDYYRLYESVVLDAVSKRQISRREV